MAESIRPKADTISKDAPKPAPKMHIEDRALPEGDRWFDRTKHAVEGWLRSKAVDFQILVPTMLANMSASRAQEASFKVDSLQQRVDSLQQGDARTQVELVKLEARAALNPKARAAYEQAKRNATLDQAKRNEDLISLKSQLEKAKGKAVNWSNRKSHFDAARQNIANPHLEELNRRREPFDQHAQKLNERIPVLEGKINEFRAKRDKLQSTFSQLEERLMESPTPDALAAFRKTAPQVQMAIDLAEAHLKDSEDRLATIHKNVAVLARAAMPLDRYAKDIHNKLKLRTLADTTVPTFDPTPSPEAARRRSHYPFGIDRSAAPKAATAEAARTSEPLSFSGSLEDSDSVKVGDYVETWNEFFPEAAFDEKSEVNPAILDTSLPIKEIETMVQDIYNDRDYDSFRERIDADRRIPDLQTRLELMRIILAAGR